METKQTALDWLLEELKSRENNTWKYPLLSYKELVMEAKAMEKEQIIEFADYFGKCCLTGGYDGEIVELKSAEQLYKETYGK